MTRARQVEPELSLLLEKLLLARTAGERDRALLQAAQGATSTAGAELWRRIEGTWLPLLGRAGASPAPPRDRVQAHLEGRLSLDLLPSGETVVRAPNAALALALGCSCDDHRRDVLEALLAVRALLEDGKEDRATAQALPTPPPTRGE